MPSARSAPFALHLAITHVQSPAWVADCTRDKAQLLHIFLARLHFLFHANSSAEVLTHSLAFLRAPHVLPLFFSAGGACALLQCSWDVLHTGLAKLSLILLWVCLKNSHFRHKETTLSFGASLPPGRPHLRQQQCLPTPPLWFFSFPSRAPSSPASSSEIPLPPPRSCRPRT